MKSWIFPVVNERYVVLAAGLINLGILMFMNRNARAGPGPGGGRRKRNNIFL